MTLTYRDIADILKAVDESEAEEIKIEVEGLRLSVRKRTGTSSPSALAQTAAPVPEQVQPSSQITDSNTVSSAKQPVVQEGHRAVRSPMVGTFYRRPNPESDSFVETGSKVSTGDPLCLIEVMKLYTTIESPTNGSIVSIFAEDGQLVEFDQQLFLIEVE